MVLAFRLIPVMIVSQRFELPDLATYAGLHTKNNIIVVTLSAGF